uniref:Putative SKP1/BTB/POZ domain, BTB/Kelch-associated n=1 Tax=Helianthus annuus TaxID=4232 RepID=A0A251S457_HELAN
MRASNFDLFDPTTLVMDSDLPPEDGCDHGDFAFAFNDSNFSDRILRIYIYSERIESTQSPSAARSPFFYKLFSNGMRESKQSHAILRINDTEEAGLMELLKFMYSNKLEATTAPAVLDVLMVADKFDVVSCMRYCSRLLRNLTMTPETVLVYLNLPSTVLMAEAFKPLTIAAKQFYAVHFKDITKFRDEILSLPLAGVEVIIASDDLQVMSENTVYGFVLQWARAQYSKRVDRRKIIMTRLAKFIRYPYLTHRILTHLLTCKEFDPKFAQTVVAEAISFKAEVPYKPQTYIRDEKPNLDRRFVERAYTYRPIKMVEFQQPRPHCVVYLELKRDLCASLFTSGVVVCSVPFNFGGQLFYLKAQRYMDDFGLFLVIVEEAGAFAFDYEFAIRYSKPTQEFVSKFKRSYRSTVGKAVWSLFLFAIPWTHVIEEDSVYFIDDFYHLRVELTDML